MDGIGVDGVLEVASLERGVSSALRGVSSDNTYAIIWQEQIDNLALSISVIDYGRVLRAFVSTMEPGIVMRAYG